MQAGEFRRHRAARSTTDSVMAPVKHPRSYLAQDTTSRRYLPVSGRTNRLSKPRVPDSDRSSFAGRVIYRKTHPRSGPFYGGKVITDLPVPRSLSSAEPYREIIEPALMFGRNAMASGRIWFRITDSSAATRQSSGSCASCVA